jgi:hypothetical protein
MRYAREELVMRLNTALSDEQLDAINVQFSGILSKGIFRQGSALRAERDEPELDDKPRLVFQFNRRNLGRLRQLIDTLNSSMPLEA